MQFKYKHVNVPNGLIRTTQKSITQKRKVCVGRADSASG